MIFSIFAQYVDCRSSTPDEVYYLGKVIGESAIQNERQIGRQVTHTYQVYNNLKIPSPRLQLSVEWPYEVQSKKGSGKHLLYLVEIQVTFL